METEKIQRGNSVLAFKAGLWYTLGNFFGKAITLITTPIFARLMTMADYGEFINFANWAITMILVANLELPNTLSKAYYDFKNEYDDYISTVTFLGLGITVFLYILFLLFPKTLLKIVVIPEQYIHLLFFFVFFTFGRAVFNARERTLYRYKTVAIITFINLFVPTLISVLLVYIIPGSDQLSARLYGFYVPSAIVGLYCVIKLISKSRVFRISYCRYALFLSIPLLFHYLAAYLLTSTNIMITKGIAGAEFAAIVSIASSTTHIFTVLSQSISGALTTWLMDNLEMKRKDAVRKGSLYYAGLLSVIVIFSILLGPEIIYFFGGEKYVSSLILLPGFMFAAFVQSVTTIFTIILTYDKNIIKTAIYTGIVALISIAAKIFLLTGNNLIILAYINVFAFSILFLINYLLVKQAGYVEAIRFKDTIYVILITGIFMMAGPFLYKITEIRYLLTVILLSFIVVEGVRYKHFILNFVKKLRK